MKLECIHSSDRVDGILLFTIQLVLCVVVLNLPQLLYLRT